MRHVSANGRMRDTRGVQVARSRHLAGGRIERVPNGGARTRQDQHRCARSLKRTLKDRPLREVAIRSAGASRSATHARRRPRPRSFACSALQSPAAPVVGTRGRAVRWRLSGGHPDIRASSNRQPRSAILTCNNRQPLSAGAVTTQLHSTEMHAALTIRVKRTLSPLLRAQPTLNLGAGAHVDRIPQTLQRSPRECLRASSIVAGSHERLGERELGLAK
jgi:hypothetical protein